MCLKFYDTFCFWTTRINFNSKPYIIITFHTPTHLCLLKGYLTEISSTKQWFYSKFIRCFSTSRYHKIRFPNKILNISDNLIFNWFISRILEITNLTWHLSSCTLKNEMVLSTRFFSNSLKMIIKHISSIRNTKY